MKITMQTITRNQSLVRTEVAADMLGVHPMTLRRWTREGKVRSVQIGGERRIPLSELQRLLGEPPAGVIALYGRVSGHRQRADLATQLDVLREWAGKERPGRETLVLSDIGSGLNARRKNLQRLLRLVSEGRVSEVVITFADRLTRFGREYLEVFFAAHGVRLTVLSAAEQISVEQELVEDLLTLVTCFSGRLYGRRSHQQQELRACLEKALCNT